MNRCGGQKNIWTVEGLQSEGRPWERKPGGTNSTWFFSPALFPSNIWMWWCWCTEGPKAEETAFLLVHLIPLSCRWPHQTPGDRRDSEFNVKENGVRLNCWDPVHASKFPPESGITKNIGGNSQEELWLYGVVKWGRSSWRELWGWEQPISPRSPGSTWKDGGHESSCRVWLNCHIRHGCFSFTCWAFKLSGCGRGFYGKHERTNIHMCTVCMNTFQLFTWILTLVQTNRRIMEQMNLSGQEGSKLRRESKTWFGLPFPPAMILDFLKRVGPRPMTV